MAASGACLHAGNSCAVPRKLKSAARVALADLSEKSAGNEAPTAPGAYSETPNMSQVTPTTRGKHSGLVVGIEDKEAHRTQASRLNPLETGPKREQILDALQGILGSSDFIASDRNRRFLQYVVEKRLAGDSDRLKGYTIAVEVFGRDTTFDANIDPVVRVEARRLRDALERYYLTAGKADAVRISIPKGGYAPVFEQRVWPHAQSEPAAQPTSEPPPSKTPGAGARWVLVASLATGLAVIALVAIAFVAIAYPLS
jgi:hypothetical protein